MDAEHLRRLFVLANSFKDGDLLVGGTRDDALRADARRELLATPLAELHRTPLVEDGVSDALARSVDGRVQKQLDTLTVHRLKQRLLAPQAAAWFVRHRTGLTSEVIAAAAKVMSDDELSRVA